MKKYFSICLFILFLSAPSSSQNIPVHEQMYISVGGIDQWITINGNNRNNPVVLLLHGGPGSVMSAYNEDEIFKDWKKDFTLVHWDQRGAGRTFGKNAPALIDEDYWIQHPLSINQMISDAIEVSEYLVKHLNKQKIIIIGTSWGSVIGAKIALERPDLYHAYIAHAQVVKPFSNTTYNKVLKLARLTNDTASVNKLNSMGIPPYDDAKNAGHFLRIIKKFEEAVSIKAPGKWWKIKPDYENETDSKNREDGDDYSFINYVGHKKSGIHAMMNEIDFLNGELNFKIPVYFIQGEHDILTPKEITKAYFDKINAPVKEFYLIQGAAHGFNQAVVDAQYRVLRHFVLN